MSAAWGRSPERDDSHILGIAKPTLLVPVSRKCAYCEDHTDAGDRLCPTCKRHEQMEAR